MKKLMLVICISLSLYDCKKEKPNNQQVVYVDRIAQDLNYRLGKWYSVSNGAGYGMTYNPLLDTIWFVSDSGAEWIGYGLSSYTYRTTYFTSPYIMVTLGQDRIDTSKLDTTYLNCGATVSNDTFAIYWPLSSGSTFPEQFVKLKE